jgi:hypothetical protein
LEIDLKKEVSKIPAEDRKLLQAMDTDHNGKVSLKEFLTSVQAQMGVSKPTAGSKLGIVSQSNANAMDNPVIKVLKGFYDVLTGPGLVAQEVAPSAPAAPAKAVKPVTVPAATTKPTGDVVAENKKPEIITQTDLYLFTNSNFSHPRHAKMNQTGLGVRYYGLPNENLSSRLTLMQPYADVNFTFDNHRAVNQNNFEKSLKGDKADGDSLKGNLISGNSKDYLGWGLRGAAFKENPFVSRWNSQNFYRSGVSFFGDKDTFTYMGPALTFGGDLNGHNALAVSLNVGTALETKSKNVSIGSQNQYSFNTEYIHEMEGFSDFILRFSLGATAAITISWVDTILTLCIKPQGAA